MIARIEHDLNWYGKHDEHGDQRQRTLGMDIAINIEKWLRTLSDNLDKPTHRSFANRVHTLTVMQKMIETATTTDSSGVSSSCRNQAYNFDDIFVGAVQKLTEGQHRRLKVLDRGAWVKQLGELITECDAYCKWPRLRNALVLIDPEAAGEVPMAKDLADFYG